jgi:hypothetical protein
MSFVPQDYLYNVARGKVSGAQPFSAYGRVTTAGAASGLLWPNGVYTYPASSGVQVRVVSDSANDAAAGTGARTIDIHYLDANLAEQVETVTMNGTTPVNTVATNIRFIQCMHIVTFGSLKATAGNIVATNLAATENYSYISTGKLRCSSSLRMVPAGKRLLVSSFFGGSISGSAGAATRIQMATPTFDGHDFTSSSIFMPLSAGAFQDNSGGITINCPVAFTEGQSLGMVYEVDKAATIVGTWFGWLENA